jgi:hypothetical protein
MEKMSPDEEVADRLYQRYRSYVEHENHLVNFRVGWLVAAEGGAIIWFGWTLHAMSDSHNPATYTWFLYLVAWLALLFSIVAAISIIAAIKAIKRLETDWIELKPDLKAQDYLKKLPHVTGGGSAWASGLGHGFSLALPIIFGAGWIAAIVYLFLANRPN